MSIKHKHFMVIATFEETPFVSETFTNEWIEELVEEIDMEILKKPSSVHCNEEGNEGISSFCLITTSHIALHSWEKLEPNLMWNSLLLNSTIFILRFKQGLITDIGKERLKY